MDGEVRVVVSQSSSLQLMDCTKRQIASSAMQPPDLIESCQQQQQQQQVITSSEEADRSMSSDETQSEDECGLTKETVKCCKVGPLKSVLKTGTDRKNKGLKVSFHDAQIFLIDMDAQVSSSSSVPQLLLPVHTFELPVVMTTTTATAFDFVPSLPPGSYDDNRHYTYEDAIVSFDDFNDDLVVAACGDALDITNSAAAATAADCPLLSALQQESLVNSIQDDDEEVVQRTSSSDDDEEAAAAAATESAVAIGSLQSLTEENLKQHEILMEKTTADDQEEVSAPEVSTEVQLEAAMVASSSSSSSSSSNLSPPLKELTVDVQVFAKETTDDWQVELSPLNSIPDSEETESSTSSQDTIIMMTSDESRRNEEHIQMSTDTFQKVMIKQESDVDASSWDSDETVTSPPPPPPNASSSSSIVFIVENKKDDDDDVNDVHQVGANFELQQKTSDQIRQILERNAVRRNVLRCNVKKKPLLDNGLLLPPIEKHRQWRSHESLLDTIKKLTLDDEDDDEDKDVIQSALDLSSSSSDLGGLPNDGPTAAAEVMTSLDQEQQTVPRRQQSLNLIAFAKAASCDRLVEDIQVPKDVRQWKIRSNMWNALNGGGGGGSNLRMGNSFMKMSRPDGGAGGGGSLPCIADKSDDRVVVSDHDDDEDEQSKEAANDELLEFVTQGSDRIERIRKRYSYSSTADYGESSGGGGDYETQMAAGFARRPSVRGIKPRFGSTTEILKQMQSHLQPPPLAIPLSSSSSNHMTWPYPLSRLTSCNNNNNSLRLPPPPPQYQHPHHNRNHQTSASLPVLQEELLNGGSTCRVLPTYSNKNDYEPVYRSRRGRGDTHVTTRVQNGINGNVYASPPPYQPPPPPPPFHQAQRPPPNLFQVVAAKGERGVPEGAASSSPHTPYDVIYQTEVSHQQQTKDNSSSCVYYAMQV